MTRQPFLHELLRDVISGTTFPIEFDSVTDMGENNDGTHNYKLHNVCNFYHVQPDFRVTIPLTDSHGALENEYIVVDYDTDEKTLTVQGSVLTGATSFNLYKPFFFHGTPQQQENELKKIDVPDNKTPMIYLIEPYKIDIDKDPESSFSSSVKFTLCFLSQSNIEEWFTDDFYHRVLRPMENLFNDTITAIENANIFYNDGMKLTGKIHAKFGINVTDSGTKEKLFSENLSGVSVEISADVYEDTTCSCSD